MTETSTETFWGLFELLNFATNTVNLAVVWAFQTSNNTEKTSLTSSLISPTSACSVVALEW